MEQNATSWLHLQLHCSVSEPLCIRLSAMAQLGTDPAPSGALQTEVAFISVSHGKEKESLVHSLKAQLTEAPK